MSAKDIRNIVLLGHSGSGKTTLAESMLYLTGGTDRLGRIADGNTVCDYDPEEIRRQISISLAVAPVEYDSCKINVLDVPGGFDFAGEVAEAVQAADAAVIVCSAKAGMSVGAEKAWKYCEKNSLPRLLYISKTDEENSDYNAAFNTLRERFGKNIAPVVAPIWDESKKVIGIIDVLHKRAFEFGPGGGRVEIEVPENKKPVLDELYDALKESVAETSEEFMEKFFAGEDFTYAEMIHGLRQGVKDLSLFPVVCGSAIQGMGTRILMDTIVELLPQPQDARALMAENEDGESSEFVVAPGALPTAFVFKTISDQYGKYSYVKVLSGSIKPDMPMVNARTGETEKLGRLYIPKGKKYTEVKELTCGDIGAIAKMDKVKTGDTLWDIAHKNDLTFRELCALNTNFKGEPLNEKSNIREGDELIVTKEEAALEVRITRIETREEEVAFAIETTKSNEYTKGTTKVLQEGQNGLRRVTFQNVYDTNNVLVEQTILSTEVIKEPVNKKVVQGTKKVKSSTKFITGSGQFIWPVPNYRYCSRWYGGRHRGVDICAPAGTPIYASAGGTITKAGYNKAGAGTGYGYSVIINHGGGYSSVYAHCLSLTVSAGQTVKQGQLIGYVGSTGRSTGNHCHFEIRLNGSYIPPQNVFPGRK